MPSAGVGDCGNLVTYERQNCISWHFPLDTVCQSGSIRQLSHVPSCALPYDEHVPEFSGILQGI